VRGRYGCRRDGKRGKMQVNYGRLCDRMGRPVFISAHPGNVRDNATLAGELKCLQQCFSLSQIVVIGDRGMIAKVQIEALRHCPDFNWITALKSATIRKLMRDGLIDAQDRSSLVELEHPDYSGERLVVCRNQALAWRRAAKRETLLQATEALSDKLSESVAAGRVQGANDIGVKRGEVIGRCKMKKHFAWHIDDTSLSCRRDAQSIAAEANLDGIYVISHLDRCKRHERCRVCAQLQIADPCGARLSHHQDHAP